MERNAVKWSKGTHGRRILRLKRDDEKVLTANSWLPQRVQEDLHQVDLEEQ
jgi:hypothetical protein